MLEIILQWQFCDLTSKKLNFLSLDIIQLRRVDNNTYIDTINNLGQSNVAILDNELLIREGKELYRKEAKYVTSDQLFSINHGVRQFNSDYFMGYISTYYEPLKAKSHPFMNISRFNFEAFKELNFGIKKNILTEGISKVTKVSQSMATLQILL